MYPGPPPPPAPKPRANRLAAGLFWLLAAAAAVAATFFDIYHSRGRPTEFIGHFWRQKVINNGREFPSGQVPYGVTVLIGAVVVLVAALLVFMARRRRVGMVVGTFGTGVLVAETVHWLLIVLATPIVDFDVEPGFWLLVASAVLALVAWILSVAERGTPARPMGYAPPPPPGPPRWEPPTPRYGVQQQHPPAPPQPPQPAQPAQPDRTTSVNQPDPPAAQPDTGGQKPDDQ